MGFNTTIIVRNDGIHDIAADPEFGKKVAEAIQGLNLRENRDRGIDIAAGSSVNAATVIETHHASSVALVAVGGNYATVLDHTADVHHHTEAGQVAILESLAGKLGFALIKKGKK